MERFGISLDDYYIEVRRKKAYFMLPEPKKYGTTGIPLCRMGAGIKPTSYAMQFLGRHVKRNFIKLSKADAMKFVEGYDIGAECSRGYVAVFHGDDCLGIGFCRDGLVENLLPKSMRRKLLDEV